MRWVTAEGCGVHEARRGAIRTYWTEAQMAVLGQDLKCCIWWGANGIGKSWLLAEWVRRALGGMHPWQQPGPQVVMLVGQSWKQLSQTLEYLWDIVDKTWFRERIRFEDGALKGQRLSVYDIVGGPGKGGKLWCGTFTAGAKNLAGPRATAIATDEPLPETIHNELMPRLLGRKGRMLQTFTVTLGTSHKLEYLWDLVDDESKPWIGQIQTILTLDAVTPRGSLVERPWMSAQEIRELEEGVSRKVANMRMGRTRYPLVDGAYFDRWGPHLVKPCDPPAGAILGIGVDHGSKPGAQRAVLVAFAERGLFSRAWVLDEYKGDGRTESEEDARGILGMLDRHGIALPDVDRWIGDRSHRGDKRGGKKSNARLQRAIARERGINTRRHDWRDKLPPALRDMRTPRKYDGSHWDGMELLHRLMVGDDPRLTVDPRCEHLIGDFEAWEGATTDPHKDGIDAARYIIVPLVEGEEH